MQWFDEVCRKLRQAGQIIVPPEGKPTYQSLAEVLKRAFRQLDRTFLDDL